MNGREKAGLFVIFVIVLIAGIAVGVCFTASFGKVVPVEGAQAVENPVKNPASPPEPSQLLKSTQESFREIVKAVSPAVCTVKVITRIQGMASSPFHSFEDDPFFKWFFGPQFGPQQQERPQEWEVPSQGSGFIVSPEGYILTNNHVVQNADEIVIILNGLDEYDAQVVGLDPDSDIAVLKIEGDEPFPYIEMGDSDAIQVGDWVMAIGNPFGYLDHTVTVGVISAKNRERITGAQYENFLQTDAAINFGNSGGPLVNIYGQAVGLSTAITAQGSGIGFAVPINMAKQVYEDITQYGEVRRAWVGITIGPATEEDAERLNLEHTNGALVMDVSKGDPAEKAGIKADDFIIKVEGTRTLTPSQVSRLIAEQAIGEPFNLTVIRDGKEKTFSVTPTKRSATPIILGGTNTVDIHELGITIRDIDEELRSDRNIPEDVKGVMITQVDRGSNAYRKNLRPGVVITGIEGENVHSVEEFVEKFKGFTGKSAVVLDILYIRSDGSTDADVVAIKLE
jgi:serine protease Do